MLDQICKLARCAGSCIMKFYYSDKPINISYKSDQTPITNVDRAANNIIKKRLFLIAPHIPIISEEDLCNFKICHHWNHYWLIDLLDGTKEFLKKWRVYGEYQFN